MHEDIVEYLCRLAPSEEARREIRERLRGQTSRFSDKLSTYADSLDNRFGQLADLMQAGKINPGTFEQYRGMYSGKKVVVAGTGPTLRDYVPLKDVIHIGVNGAVMNNAVPWDYIVIQDTWAVYSHMAGLKKSAAVKLFATKTYMSTDAYYGYRVTPRYASDLDAREFFLAGRSDPCRSADISFMPCGTYVTTASTAFVFALLTNPSHIYLVGMDAALPCGAQLRRLYDQIFLQAFSKVHSDFTRIFRNNWMLMRDFAVTNYPDTEIVSINPVGLKGVFRDAVQDSKTGVVSFVP